MVLVGTPGGSVSGACGCPLGTGASAGLSVTWKAEQRARSGRGVRPQRRQTRGFGAAQAQPQGQDLSIPFPAVPGSVELSPALPAPSKTLK